MATLMTYKAPGMNRARICNSHCYNAKRPKCICICCNINHGVGLDRAVENTKQVAKDNILKGVEVKIYLL